MIDKIQDPTAAPGKHGFQVKRFSMERRMVRAVATEGRLQNNIHAMTEVDISVPRRLMREHKQRHGESLSLTAYVIACLGRAISIHPDLNAFHKGRKLVILDDVTISSQIEREIDGVLTPEPIGIQTAQQKDCRQITDEIRAAQSHEKDGFGGLSGVSWLRFLPAFLFRVFIRIASQSTSMMARYGAVGVTAVGMYGPRNQAGWLLPLVGGATVAVAVGAIVERPVLVDGRLEFHEHLCLTVSFNHDIVDGAPAARFLRTFSEYLKGGELVDEGIQSG